MTASLCIHVPSETKSGDRAIKFFDTEVWTADSEKQLLAKILETISTIRVHCQSLEVSLHVEASDIETVTFLLKKKANQDITVNNQKLTLREIEVLGLIMQGLTNNEIAEKLFISYETVKSHRKNILIKTGARNTAALINHYHQTFFEK